MKTLFTLKRLLQSLAILIGLTVVVIAVRQNPTAREVVTDAFAGLFGFFTTPFILEASIALGGLIAVVTYNQWRISREGDGWVTLPDSERHSENAPTSLASQPPEESKATI